jgi:hypothetical protein
MGEPSTLTDALNRSQVAFIPISDSSTASNVRTVPYAERYRAFNSVLQTPLEHLAEATRDEKNRRHGS